MNPKLIVHGGAWNIPENECAAHLEGLQKAVDHVYPLLRSGLTALDAVEKAVNMLELDPTFDAGRGAFLNAVGEIELDAMIMDGSNLDYGAVAGVQNYLHPVSIARKVMERTEHCFLIGNGAQRFADRMEFVQVKPEELLTEREREYYERIKHDPGFTTRRPFDRSGCDTVGAVALDQYGNLAAATSTGGTPRKLPGRVGDSPIIGAGAYADNLLGAASATGWGESILKVLLSKTTCDMLRTANAMDAAERAIELLGERVKGLGGVIVISNNGDYGFAHNTPQMAFAYMADDQIEVNISAYS
ncbi:isoaspartyl peptidase/L-asparaginase [candidate division KSB1 bacterium]|nr:isoaspartyl peptidase/L-asparaginase [candidate division KSB1 bacterium]